MQIQKELNIEYKTILSILLIDDKDNHEYFAHKYNISNELKYSLRDLANNYKKLLKDKFFLTKDLKKNIYYNGKENLKTLNILYYSSHKKLKIKDLLNILKSIKNTKIPKLPIDGNYLKKKE